MSKFIQRQNHSESENFKDIKIVFLMLNNKEEPTNRMLEAGTPTQRLLPSDQIQIQKI